MIFFYRPTAVGCRFTSILLGLASACELLYAGFLLVEVLAFFAMSFSWRAAMRVAPRLLFELTAALKSVRRLKPAVTIVKSTAAKCFRWSVGSLRCSNNMELLKVAVLRPMLCTEPDLVLAS